MITSQSTLKLTGFQVLLNTNWKRMIFDHERSVEITVCESSVAQMAEAHSYESHILETISQRTMRFEGVTTERHNLLLPVAVAIDKCNHAECYVIVRVG